MMKFKGWIQLIESKHRHGEGVHLHDHPTYQILYALEDHGKIVIDGKTFPFKQDDVAFLVPYTKHAIYAQSKLTILVLEFTDRYLDEWIQEGILNPYLGQSNLLTLNIVHAGEIRQLLRKMLYEQSVGQSLNRLALKVYLQELLLLLVRAQEEGQMLDANTARVERLRKYIDTHYYEMIDAKYISDLLGMSIRHINNIFKEHYQKTPIQYLNEVRMELSKKMLMESDKDIVSICFEVGFESLSTFYRAFKNYTNVSPNQFREMYRNKEIED